MSDNATFQTGDPGNTSDNQQGTFNGKGPGDTPPPTPNNVDLAKLSKRVDDSQAFIETLKKEAEEYRREIAELKARKGPDLNEIKELINKGREGTDNTPDLNALVDQAAAKLKQSQAEEQANQQAEANFKEVASVFQSKFGDKVDEEVTKLAGEVGMSFADVVGMAKRNPKAVFKLFGLKDNTSAPTPTKSGVNTQAFKPQPDTSKRKNILQAKNSKEQVDIYQRKLAEVLKRN